MYVLHKYTNSTKSMMCASEGGSRNNIKHFLFANQYVQKQRTPSLAYGLLRDAGMPLTKFSIGGFPRYRAINFKRKSYCLVHW